MQTGDFFTRHTLRPSRSDQGSSDYEGISEKGVDLARQRAKEIFELVARAEEGTVLFLAGTSEIARTGSTILAYGDELRKLVSEREQDDMIVLLPSDAERIRGVLGKIAFFVEKIATNPRRKIIVAVPLFLKELSFVGDFTTKEGKWTHYTRELLKRSGGDSERALREWLKSQGVIDGVRGPDPREVAEKQLGGLRRLRIFASKYIPNRPLMIGSVGHSWSLDALAVYLANNGEVSIEAFDGMRAKMIGETEMISLIQRDGKPFLRYGEQIIPLNGGHTNRE